MEEKKDTLGMLDLVIRPGFCVKENQIIKVNQAAESLFITPGTDVRPLLLTGAEEYAAFTGGCLYLTLNLSSHSWARRSHGWTTLMYSCWNRNRTTASFAPWRWPPGSCGSR